MAALSALVALTEAAKSNLKCVPDPATVTLINGVDLVCTCTTPQGKAITKVDWEFNAGAVSGETAATYTRKIASGDSGKAITCKATTADGADESSDAQTITSEDPKKPTLKCDPAKLEKDKESTCTCTSTNTKSTSTKSTFSVDGADAKDGTSGDTKNELKVKITKEAKVTCMAYFSATVKTPASDEFKIEFSAAGGGDGNSGASLPSALSFVVMMFVSIIVSIL